ncbi:hypothetical protein VE01_04917 [Pseudogymnoascus verrucosus]|uniref:Uncharacterized protein n=1 Tax=Pseudogymnoascus verrucosus TaxID=342668 RepID=A0A1B8GMF0_9PEZI|nr:uncharacterized protein VE01_04917 [Pseudogymnoascus verrucosus]OBT97007.1 hypothetical protein VE01_04917 [Pseudogymnoascus verrucosus]
MARAALALAALASVAFANPVPDLSLPPLIPYISGISELLYQVVPPTPILQAPLPPIPAAKIPSSNLKPKKVGYFWTGSADQRYADFLATYSLDDDTFGEFIHLTEVPSSGNSPHHLGPSLDGKTIVGGGLLSLLKTQDTAFYFDTTDPYRPTFKKSNRAVLSSIADEIRAKPDGGFFITYMGSTVGTSPGRLVETDKDFNIIAEHPQDLASTINILGETFAPHGLSIDWDANLILTSDFVVPVTILKPSAGIIHANTLRLWNLEKRSIIRTLTIPNGGGIQDVKFIPGNKESAAIATAVHLGQVWIIYPFRTDKDGKQGTIELLYDLGEKARDTIAIYSDLTQDGRFAYFTLTTANHIAALDISDLDNVKRLDDPNVTQPTIGPHYLKVSPDQKHLVVTDYFVQTGEIGIINTPADFKALYIDIEDNGALNFNRTIDFTDFYKTRGGAKPHSVVIYDFTDPEKPIYY